MTPQDTPSVPQCAVVVDDSASAVALMLQLLRTIDGCEPVGFTHSPDAQLWCQTNDIDLLIVDYEMPAPNGLTFIETFRLEKGKAAVPVVMVTSTEDVDVRYMALQTGATDFLTKPIDHVEFIARMRNLLAAYRTHKALAEVSLWLTEEVRKTSMVVRQSPASVVITDSQGFIEYVNPKFSEATGYPPEEVIGRKPSLLKSGNSTPETYRELWDTITRGHEWRGTFQNRRKDGSLFWEQAQVSPIRDEAGMITNFVAIMEDITLRKEYEARLEWQANYDSLTGLPNRMLVLDRMGQAIALAARNRSQVAVMLVDLDRFRAVNDTMGHDVGDAILRQVAQRLMTEQHEGDTVARVGNDEFAMVLADVEEFHAPQSVAARICASLESPFLIAGTEIFVSASIGIALYPENGTTAQELLRSATAAMPAISSEGRGGWRFFTPELDASARRRQTLETHLRHALERGEFQVHYHPLVDVETGQILAAEALLRWTNGKLGAVPPDQFIPIAEETNLIIPIGTWVIETACRDLARWIAQGLPPVRVAINVSSRQLADRALLEIIAQALSEGGFDASLIELEVTERLLLDQSPHTRSLLGDLKNVGVRFSIDDFGTGYSSMSYLTSFPFDVLKIDRSFISRVAEQYQDRALTQAIIAMAKSLDLEIVAEGVETLEQLEFLRKNSCDLAQGYLFTQPVTADVFSDTLRNCGKYTFFSGTAQQPTTS